MALFVGWTPAALFLALDGAVGGLILFGPAGLILGPVVLTVIMVLLEICNERTMAIGKNLSP